MAKKRIYDIVFGMEQEEQVFFSFQVITVAVDNFQHAEKEAQGHMATIELDKDEKVTFENLFIQSIVFKGEINVAD